MGRAQASGRKPAGWVRLLPHGGGRPSRGCAHISIQAEEAAMFSQRIRSVMERKKLLTAPPDTTVSEAAKLMAKKNIGAIMVVEDELLVGIFTERDAVFRVIARGRDTQDRKSV